MPTPTEFATPVKSPHFVSSTPAHGAILEDRPTEVTLRFNFDIVPPSEIHLTLQADDALPDYAVGEPEFSADKLSMTQALKPDLPSGLYTVSYIACWPDTSCHEGSFQFQYGLSL
jgi:methionine-rich copper-binding protein CopC